MLDSSEIGVFGDITVSSSLPFTASKALKIATAQEGTAEDPAGSNRTKFGKAFGLNGQPWCGIFVWWTFLQCGVDMRDRLDMRGYALAGVRQWETAARRAGWWRAGRSGLMPGDLVVLDSTPGATDMRDHIHMVINVGQKAYRAVGGNESHRVRVGAHDYSSRLIGYVRPPYAREKRPHGNARRVHVVAEGESLWKLAQQYYKDPNRWPEIYRQNRHLIGADPGHVLPGMKLVIP